MAVVGTADVEVRVRLDEDSLKQVGEAILEGLALQLRLIAEDLMAGVD